MEVDIFEVRIVLIMTVFFLPVLEIVFGFLLAKKTPKINHFYGYRTTRSMASKEAWEYANKTTGKIWLFLGITQTISFVPMVILLNDYISYIIMIVMPIMIIGFLWIRIEILLKKKFPNE